MLETIEDLENRILELEELQEEMYLQAEKDRDTIKILEKRIDNLVNNRYKPKDITFQDVIDTLDQAIKLKSPKLTVIVAKSLTTGEERTYKKAEQASAETGVFITSIYTSISKNRPVKGFIFRRELDDKNNQD